MYKPRGISYIALVLCLFDGAGAFAQAKRVPQQKPAKGKEEAPAGLSDNCKACLNLFSPTTLTFTSNASKCAQIMPTCKGKPAGVCESMIDSCFSFNCATEGSCTDEMANRALFSGCLKAEGATLPFTCASYIAGKASAYAAMKKNELDERNRMHERDMQQAQLRSQEQQAAQAAEAERAKAAGEAQNAQNQLAFEKQKYQQEQAAKDAELSRQQKAEQAQKNSKPNVMYNNAISEAKRAISSARTATSGLMTQMGVQATTQAAGGGNMLHTPAPTVDVPGFGVFGNDAKSRSFVNASKYGKGGMFRCTRDIRENVARSELDRVLSTLMSTRNTLSGAIGNLEMVNDDPDTKQGINDEKIDGLYEVQNAITEAITQIQTSTALMTTSCETRCNGMSSMLSAPASSSGSEEGMFDADGNIKKEHLEPSKGSDYSCKEFDASSSFDPLEFLGGSGSINVESMLGGHSKRVGELTERVLRAVVMADRAIEKAEITTSLGRSLDNEEGGGFVGGGSGSKGNTVYSCFTSTLCPETTHCIANLIETEIGKIRATNRPITQVARDELQNLINNSLLELSRFGNCGGTGNNIDICARQNTSSLPLPQLNNDPKNSNSNVILIHAEVCARGIRARKDHSGIDNNDCKDGMKIVVGFDGKPMVVPCN